MKGWGSEDNRPPEPWRRAFWSDAIVVMALAGLLFGLIHFARQWTRHPSAGTPIELAPWALPYYAFLSLARCLLACLLSLMFALAFGYWTVHDPVANRYFVPVLDVFRRGVPALGLMPVLVLALAALFPGSNIGLEIAAIVLIFMAQFWPTTSSFRHALRAVPLEQHEMADAYHFSSGQRFRWVELPATAIGLIWSSIMGMSRGWFVLMASETFVLGDEDFRLPGIGSYLRSAVEQDRPDAIVWALGTMLGICVLLHEFLWQPLLVWAQKFRLDEAGDEEGMSSWVLEGLQRLRNLALVERVAGWWQQGESKAAPRQRPPSSKRRLPAWTVWGGRLLFLALMVPLASGCWQLLLILSDISPADWLRVSGAGLTTLARVLSAVALATVVALPAGLALGLSPRWSQFLQPGVQVLASFPTSLLFPLLIAGFHALGISLGWGSVVLMFLPAQAYILFNTIAGATAIPADLKEAVRSYRLQGWQRFWTFHVPAVFPALVRGWDAAISVAWSTSVVAEYTTLNQEVLQTWGLGAWISAAASTGDFAQLAAAVLVMVFLRETFNRLVLEPCYHLARERFSMNR